MIIYWLINIMIIIKSIIAKYYLFILHFLHLKFIFSIIIFDNSHIDFIIRSEKWIYNKSVKRLWFSLIASIFLKMINEIQFDEKGINVKSTLCVIFIDFLRSEEFTWNTWFEQYHASHFSWKYIFFATNSITLILPMSKTDFFCKSINVHLISLWSSLCSMTIFIQLFNTFSCSFLQPFFICLHEQLFTKQFFIIKICQLLLQASISIADFSDHFIRKEVTIIVIVNDIFRENIQFLSRWKNDIIDIYINEIHEFEQIQKLFQLNSQLLNHIFFFI